MASATVTKPTLTYFNSAGRAEVPRILLEDAGVDYDFVAITNWAEVKPEYQAAGKAPFGQLPIYEEPGLVLAQSSAIARHVAREHGYYGETAHDAALIDQASEGVADIVSRLIQALFLPLPDDKRAEAKASLLNEFLPAQFEIYSKLLEKNGNNGHLVGSKLSVADVSLWVTLGMVFSRVEGSKDAAAKYPNLQAFLDGVASRQRIKAYLARDVYAAKKE
ncbi:glutathione S-transferase, C-terminal domain containing protein [Acanthamoeba castellanii str. Neff]|uniref:Glutathione S-transferase, C-terminal domain containing protein n=1 Tax=Acanthamoeba castellanii (strain ATCC 30010 / Neff) TaxID=1257118 RepID=L8H8K7_ACACF|nr:glutathione S-transferase, C-terminal domain containing protein [Acanthamoeba castellanii str. Neff]ELR20801.1 glutathione S-transferase, C-terminal domain containing protein [Acanthamoeba castellanii str. Neff]